jgi:hypothetical protein
MNDWFLKVVRNTHILLFADFEESRSSKAFALSVPVLKYPGLFTSGPLLTLPELQVCLGHVELFTYDQS